MYQKTTWKWKLFENAYWSWKLRKISLMLFGIQLVDLSIFVIRQTLQKTLLNLPSLSWTSMVEPTDCRSVDCYTFLRNIPTVKFFPALTSHYISELSQTISHCICIWPQLFMNLQTKNHVKTQTNSILYFKTFFSNNSHHYLMVMMEKWRNIHVNE